MEESQHDWGRLLEQARRHDPTAAEALIEALYPVVRAVVHRRRPPASDPRDLTQDALLRTLQGLERFRGNGSSLPAWARRIAFRVCLNEWRRRKSRPERLWTDLSEEQLALLEGTRDTFANADSEAAAARELVNLLLDRLQPEERWVIELADLEERSLEEIREITGWSALNIRVRRFRARQKLRRALAQLSTRQSHER